MSNRVSGIISFETLVISCKIDFSQSLKKKDKKIKGNKKKCEVYYNPNSKGE